MINRIVLTGLLIVGLCAFSTEQGVICLAPAKHQFTIQQLRTELCGGTWTYHHSYFSDTCFVVEDLLTVPESMRFYPAKDSSFIRDKEWLATRRNAYLRDIACNIVEQKTGREVLTFPAGGGKWSPDSLISFMPMFHLPASKQSGMTRKVDYMINSIHGDTLQVSTGHHMTLRGKSEHDITHVFLRVR